MKIKCHAFKCLLDSQRNHNALKICTRLEENKTEMCQNYQMQQGVCNLQQLYGKRSKFELGTISIFIPKKEQKGEPKRTEVRHGKEKMRRQDRCNKMED